MTSPADLVVEFAPGFGPFDVIGAGNWVDLSDRILEAEWQIGRDNEFDPFPAGEATLLLTNDDRLLDPDYTAGTHFGNLLPRVPFRLQSVHSALSLPGVSGATASTPDHSSFAVTDLDVRVHMSATDWTPAGFGYFVVGQWPNVSGNNGWILSINSSGNLVLTFTTGGVTNITRTSTAATGFTDGTNHWIRVTLDVDNGAAGHDVKFYTSSDGDTWTQLGTTITTAGTTSIFNSTAVLAVGDIVPLNGKVRQVQLLSGIDGSLVANPDFMAVNPGTTSFVDSTGKTWTVNGTASIAIDTATRFDEFYGFVQDGWEQDLQPPRAALCRVRLVDKIAVLAGGYRLPDVFEYSLLSTDTSPTALWVLDSSSEANEVADKSGNGHDGTVIGNVQFGERSIHPGHGTSALFPASESAEADNTLSYIDIGWSPFIASADMDQASVVVTFLVRNPVAGTAMTLFIHSTGATTESQNQIRVYVGGDDKLVNYVYRENGVGNSRRWPTTVTDGVGHVMFGQPGGIAIDTATLNTAASGVGAVVTQALGIGGSAGLHATGGFDGWIGAVAVYNYPLSSTERSNILTGYNKLSGQRSDEHIAWALDRVGVPSAHRSLATGTVLMGPAVTGGRDALDYIREIVDTEQGQFYVDHRNAGVLRFTDRYHRFLNSRSTTTQAAFSDDPAVVSASVVRVERGELNLSPNGIDSIINQVTVTWRDGEETTEDAASVAAYGPRPRQVDTQATTAAQARSVGEWIVARYAQPRSRIRGLGIKPDSARGAFSVVHRLQINDRATNRLHPQQVGSATTTNLFVEGVANRAGRGFNWTTHYSFSPVETFVPWIWGTSAWDQTTYWG